MSCDDSDRSCSDRLAVSIALDAGAELDQDDAKLFAERLRAALRHEIERDYPSLTCSLGIVTFPGAAVDWEDCVRQADEAMYKAKRLGRDQTRFELAEVTS
jgi:GGDEF domain-containing protein